MRKWWSKVRRQLDTLREVKTPNDILLVLRLYFFIAISPALLRLKIPRLATILEPKQCLPPANHSRIQKIIRYVDLIFQVGSPTGSSVCLTRGITLYYFLRRVGLDVAICFGMGTVEENYVGHCWLVRNWEPFLETQDPRLLFTEVYRFPVKREPL